MSDGNQFFRPLPGGAGFQTDRAVFGDDKIDILPGQGGDGAGLETGDDAGNHGAVLFGMGGGQANEAAAALGPVGTEYEI